MKKKQMHNFGIALFALIVACSSGVRKVGPEDEDAGADSGVTDTSASIPGWEMEWAVRAGGTDHGYYNADYGHEVAAFPGGGAVVGGTFCGYCSGDTVFGEGTPGETILPGCGGDTDGFLARYDEKGNLLWARQFGGWYFDAVYGLEVTSEEYSLVSGIIEMDGVFGEGEPNETHLQNVDYFSFLAKFDPDGNLVWAKTFDSEASHRSFSLSLNEESDTLHIVGYFREPYITFGEGEDAVTVETHGGTESLYVAAMDLDGNVKWARGASGPSSIAHNVASLPGGGAVIGGYFLENIVFEASKNGMVSLECEGMCNYLAGYDRDGKCLWARNLGKGQGAPHVAVAAQEDTIVVTLQFWDITLRYPDILLPDPENPEAGPEAALVFFIESYTGEIIWEGCWLVPGSLKTRLDCSTVLKNGEIFTTSVFYRDLYMPMDVEPLIENKGRNSFIALIDPEGHQRGITAMNNEESAWSIIADTSSDGLNALYATGAFATPGEFESCFGAGNDDDICIQSSSKEAHDIFLFKMIRTEPIVD